MSQNVKSSYQQWQLYWGTPRGVFVQAEGWKMEVAFLIAILFHALPFSYVWHKQTAKKAVELITLQNVELIEAEEELPPPPPPQVEKPKNAFDFLKMALPKFSKPEAPRDIALTPKMNEPKIAEPEKLIDKKLNNQLPAPDIRLDLNKNAPAPKIMDISKLNTRTTAQPKSIDAAIKLEEVGRRAVAPPPMAPAISMNRTADKMADVSQAPKISNIAQTRQAEDRLVDRTAPAAYKAPSLPIGYAPRGAAAVSLDQPRDVVRRAPTPDISKAVTQETKAPSPARIEISKEKVKITGPLSSRKVVQSFVPQYPDWARARNIEADVAIRFNVSAAGDVRDDAVVEMTSGYPELDKAALAALKRWKFTPLAGNNQDQWGVITFRYRLD